MACFMHEDVRLGLRRVCICTPQATSARLHKKHGNIHRSVPLLCGPRLYKWLPVS